MSSSARILAQSRTPAHRRFIADTYDDALWITRTLPERLNCAYATSEAQIIMTPLLSDRIDERRKVRSEYVEGMGAARK